MLKILPHYHAHLQANPTSLLVRFYGLHRVQVAGRRGKIYFVVMGNIFPPDRPLRSIYDLKVNKARDGNISYVLGIYSWENQ